MGKGTGGDVRYGRSRLFGSAHPGFVLTELLSVLLILAFLCGTMSVSVGSVRNSRGNPEREADLLARRLSKAIIEANRLGVDFTLFCSGSVAKETLEIRWDRFGRREIHASTDGCRFLRYQNPNSSSIYSPQWNTLTPAATIKVSNGNPADDRYVIVSLYGRVRTDTLPPRKGKE